MIAQCRAGTVRSFPTALGHAETVARGDPSNERACRIVMMAAYAGGDQERAVRAYMETRAALARGLGAEPLLETQALYLAILRHESPTSLLPDDIHRPEIGAFLAFMDRVDAERSASTADLSATTSDGRLLPVAIVATRISIHRRRAVLALLRPIERRRESDPRLLATLRAAPRD